MTTVQTVPDQSGDVRRINKVILGHLGSGEATDQFMKYFCGSVDVPDDLIDRHQKLDYTFQYVPFLAFDIDFDSDWTADIGYEYQTKETSYSAGRAYSTTKTHVRWQPGSGRFMGKVRFLYPASTATLSNVPALSRLAEQIPPSRASALGSDTVANEKCLPMDVMEGAETERYVSARLGPYVQETVKKSLPGDKNQRLHVSYTFSVETEALLIPFWFYDYGYGGTRYQDVCCAVTGAVDGERPRSGKRWVKAAILAGTFFAANISSCVAASKVVYDGEKAIWSVTAAAIILMVASPVTYLTAIWSKKKKWGSLTVSERARSIGHLRRLDGFLFGVGIMTALALLVGAWILFLYFNGANSTSS